MDRRGLAVPPVVGRGGGGGLVCETHATSCRTASNEAMDIRSIIIND